MFIISHAGFGIERVWPLGLACLMPVRPPRREHLNVRFDREAVALTLDAEALITALAKLRRLELLPLPLQANDKFEDRLDDIAIQAGIPEDRLREILAGHGTGTDHYSPMAEPHPAKDERLVFPPAVRQKWASRVGWLTLFASTAVAALVVAAGRHHGASGVSWVFVMAAALAALWLCNVVISWALSLAMGRALRRTLARRLESEGLQPEAWAGTRVGLALRPELRLYNHFYDWDIGWLILAGDRFCYLGDQVCFELQRNQITGIRLGPGPPDLRDRPRVHITWQEPGAPSTQMLQRDLGKTTLWGGAARRRAWAADLQAWHDKGGGSEHLVPPLASPPTQSLPDGLPPGKALGPASVVILLLLRGGVAAAFAGLLGLSFSATDPSGWLVVVLAVVHGLWLTWPFLTYREPLPPPVDPAPDPR
jgi:hypothetical protein